MNKGLSGPIGRCASSSQRVTMTHTPQGRLSRRCAHRKGLCIRSTSRWRGMHGVCKLAARCNATGGFSMHMITSATCPLRTQCDNATELSSSPARPGQVDGMTLPPAFAPITTAATVPATEGRRLKSSIGTTWSDPTLLSEWRGKRTKALQLTLTLQTIFIRLSVNPLFHRISCRFSTAAQIHHR